MDAARIGASGPAVLNAANEVAVEAFLAGELEFTGIAQVVEEVLQHAELPEPASLDVVQACDLAARQAARDIIRERSGKH